LVHRPWLIALTKLNFSIGVGYIWIWNISIRAPILRPVKSPVIRYPNPYFLMNYHVFIDAFLKIHIHGGKDKFNIFKRSKDLIREI